MTNYEDFRHLYDFLKFKSNMMKHWIDMARWKIIKHFQNQILATSKIVIHGAKLWH
jgi:hypothetical protein